MTILYSFEYISEYSIFGPERRNILKFSTVHEKETLYHHFRNLAEKRFIECFDNEFDVDPRELNDLTDEEVGQIKRSNTVNDILEYESFIINNARILIINMIRKYDYDKREMVFVSFDEFKEMLLTNDEREFPPLKFEA